MQIQTRAGRELKVCLPLLSENELSLKESVRFHECTLYLSGKFLSRLTVQKGGWWVRSEGGVVLTSALSVVWIMWMGDF